MVKHHFLNFKISDLCLLQLKSKKKYSTSHASFFSTTFRTHIPPYQMQLKKKCYKHNLKIYQKTEYHFFALINTKSLLSKLLVLSTN